VLSLLVALLAPNARAVEPAARLVDVTADILPPGKGDIGVFWGRYRRGILPWLQLGTHLAGDAALVPNLSAKALLLDRDELRVSAEAGVAWVAVLMLTPSRPLVLFVPAALRATLPLADRWEINAAWTYRATMMGATGSGLDTSWLHFEPGIVRYDRFGAWMVTAIVPLLTRATASLDKVLGKTNVSAVINLDDLDAWGLLLSRELCLGGATHLRLGIGYRNRPGILVYESMGYVLTSLDLYWR